MSNSRNWLQSTQKDSADLVIELGGCPLTLELRQGWEVRRSGLDCDLLYFCLEGGFVVHGARGPRSVRSGEVLVVPAGQAFHFSLGTFRRARIARFRLGRPRRRSPVGGVLVFRSGRTTGAWLNALRAELAGESKRIHRSRSVLALSGLLASLELPERRQEARTGRWRGLSAQEMESIRNWADELAPKTRPGLIDLSKLLNMSPDYCARLFRQSFGQSFEKWIIQSRMRSAALRIAESRLNVSAISEEFGFSTPFFFSRQFKEVMGCSPMAYRKDHTC